MRFSFRLITDDDETLFAFYQCLRHRPRVVVVFRSYQQWIHQGGPQYQIREEETAKAMAVAGCEWEQWKFKDMHAEYHWPEVAEEIRKTVEERQPELVIYPSWLLGGHEEHNTVASILDGLELPNVVRYLSYRRGEGRCAEGTEVEATVEEITLKISALECYVSQRKHAATAPWFTGPDVIREWVAE